MSAVHCYQAVGGYAFLQLPHFMQAKARPATRVADLPLAPICSSSINYAAVLQLMKEISFPMLPRLSHMYSVLSTRSAFVEFLGGHPPPPDPGRPSSLRPQRLQEAVRYGVLRPCTRSNPPRTFHSAFPVMKSDGATSRLIINTHSVNVLVTPWPCLLPDIIKVIQTILTWHWSIFDDAKSCFYQFPLGPSVQTFFGVRQGGFKGTCQKLPQGFSPAPSIAQLTGHGLSYGIAADVPDPMVIWIDNYGAGGLTKEGVLRTSTEFRRRCRSVNLVLKEPLGQPAQVFTALGLQFDLIQHKYRPDPIWADRASTLLHEFHLEASRHWAPPLRLSWTIIGTILWWCYVTHRALGEHCWHIIDFMRQKSAEISWESTHCIPTPFLQELGALLPAFKANDFQAAPEATSFLDQDTYASWLATDASSHAGAALSWDCFSRVVLAQWWQFPEHTRLSRNMPLKEGLALLRAIQDPAPLPSPILWLGDCLPFIQAYRRRYSPNPDINQLVTTIRRIARTKGYDLTGLWIDTLLMQWAADPFSRRMDSLPFFHPIPLSFPAPQLRLAVRQRITAMQ